MYKCSDVIKRKKLNNVKEYSSGSQKCLQYLHTVTTAHTADTGKSNDKRLQLSLGALC